MGGNGYKSIYMSEWVSSLLAAVLNVVSHALGVLMKDAVTIDIPDYVHAACEYDGIRIEITIKFEVCDGQEKS